MYGELCENIQSFRWSTRCHARYLVDREWTNASTKQTAVAESNRSCNARYRYVSSCTYPSLLCVCRLFTYRSPRLFGNNSRYPMSNYETRMTRWFEVIIMSILRALLIVKGNSVWDGKRKAVEFPRWIFKCKIIFWISIISRNIDRDM